MYCENIFCSPYQSQLLSFEMAAFIRNIRHLFKHVDLGNIDPDTKSLVSTLVNLIEDPDQEVRIKFGQNIKNLLEFWKGNGFLKEVQILKFKLYKHTVTIATFLSLNDIH